MKTARCIAGHFHATTLIRWFRCGLPSIVGIWLFSGSLASAIAAPSSPPNDECTNAIVIPANQGFPQFTPIIWDVSGATNRGDSVLGEFECSLARLPGNSVWYRFNPTNSGTYIFSTAETTATFTNLDTVLAAYDAPAGCAGTLNLINCNNDVGAELRAKMYASLVANRTYLIYVALFDVYTGDDGTNTVQLRVDRVSPPTNDACTNAWMIPTNAVLPYRTAAHDIAAASDGSPIAVPDCQSDAVRSIWFGFRPTVTSRYVLSTCSEMTSTEVADTIIAVYAAPNGCDGPLTPVACIDDDETETCLIQDLQSHIETILTNGMNYLIVVWQWHDSGSVVDELLPGNSLVQLYVANRNDVKIAIKKDDDPYYRLDFSGLPNHPYEVQGSDDLTVWTRLGDATWNPTTQLYSYFHNSLDPVLQENRPRQFYRVLLPDAGGFP